MFKRIFFLKSHELEIDGAKLMHSAGYYYHVAVAYVEKLIADGIAELESVHETLPAEAVPAAQVLGDEAGEFEHQS